jgi:hypothetical protein
VSQEQFTTNDTLTTKRITKRKVSCSPRKSNAKIDNGAGY